MRRLLALAVFWSLMGSAFAADPARDQRPHPFPKRQPAPEFPADLAWLNTAKPLSLAQLRGKFVVLDFWTYCCINCMHILPELAKLERAYPDQVVVIGVHSAKFDGEKLDANIRDAILRYRIKHPVVNDAGHAIWDAYAVTSWPSIRVIDPEGNFIAGESGELEFEVLDRFLREAIPFYRANGSLDEKPFALVGEKLASEGPLKFPGKLAYDESTDRLFVADSGNDRIVVAKIDRSGEPPKASVEMVIGSGRTGDADGGFDRAAFNQPQGVALSDADTLWIADTENHLIRRADLKSKLVQTVAGTGRQARGPWPGMQIDQARRRMVRLREDGRYVADPATTPLNSPWDLCVHGNAVYIAMAGAHQIWRMPLDLSEIGVYAGNGREDIFDGKLLPREPYQEGSSSFAQPSGLATDGARLFVADSEGSSIRVVPLPDAKGNVRGTVQTLVGTADLKRARLFTFGDVDGDASTARLQHPLGVAWHDGGVYVVDTYNDKLKVVAADSGKTRTVAGGMGEFNEPGGIAFGAGRLWVADTDHHRILAVDPSNGAVHAVELTGLGDGWTAAAPQAPVDEPREHLSKPASPAVQVDAVRVAPTSDGDGRGSIRLDIALEPPKGWKVNDLMPLKWEVVADGDGPVDPAGLGLVHTVEHPKDGFVVPLPIAAREGVVELTLVVETGICSEAEGECRPVSVAIRIPVTLAEDGAAAGRVTLPLPRAAAAGGIPGLDLFR